jgi:hypothetical protein
VVELVKVVEERLVGREVLHLSLRRRKMRVWSLGEGKQQFHQW